MATRLLLFAVLCTTMTGCIAWRGMVTREELDSFTITKTDTTVTSVPVNPAGYRDNGVVFPTTRQVNVSRDIVQYDSVEKRFYPDFIRLGLFESVGLLGTSNGVDGLGGGLFGVFDIFNDRFAKKRLNQPSEVLWTGGIYRFGIVEWRLRWFNDSPNWTLGTSLFENIIPSVLDGEGLFSILPIYLKKRFYLREEIPYVAISPSVGFGLLGSQYANFSTSLDIGSIGGLNARLYGGYAYGLNLANTTANPTSQALVSNFPYVGLGVSVLDFLNLPSETVREWKHHEHSAWRIGILNVSGVFSGTENSIFAGDSLRLPITGGQIEVAPVALALPILDHKLFVGTTLFNVMILGKTEIGLGVLPIRVGYWQTLIPNDLILEPFFEYNYYPSDLANLGARAHLRFSDVFNFNATLGYVNGSIVRNLSDLFDDVGELDVRRLTAFSTWYFGVGIALTNQIFDRSELRYVRQDQGDRK